MKKRVPQGKKNEKQMGKASCFQLVEKRIAHYGESVCELIRAWYREQKKLPI